MALWEGFAECWKDMTSRIDHHLSLVDHLKNNEEILQPQKSKHFLSIGPGSGEVDYGVLKLLPGIISYTAVEPDEDVLSTLRSRLAEVPAQQKHYIKDTMESFQGPIIPSDVILMCHVAYYFSETFDEQIRRALSWLNKGGRIWLVHDQNTIHKLIASEFNISYGNNDLLTVPEVRRHLVDMKVNFNESEVPYNWDISYPGDTYYGFVSIMLNRQATKEEVDRALSVISNVFVPGTKTIQGTQSLFVIQKS